MIVLCIHTATILLRVQIRIIVLRVDKGIIVLRLGMTEQNFVLMQITLP